MLPIFFASQMDQFTHINLHFITKHEDGLAFHSALCLEVFTTDRTMDLTVSTPKTKILFQHTCTSPVASLF